MNFLKPTLNIGFVFLIALVSTLALSDSADAQRKTARPAAKPPVGKQSPTKKSEGATIRGKVIQHKKFKIPFDEVPTSFVQFIKAPAPPVPDDFEKMKLEEREAWAKKFMETAAGKKFMADKKKLLDSARSFKVKVEDDGRFVIYGVPPGQYSLKGRVEKKIGAVTHVHEIFGSIEVLEDVDEMNLKPLDIVVTPLLVAGNKAPTISVNTWDDKAKLVNKHFAGKNLFVCFWSSKSPPSIEYVPKVQAMFKALKDNQKLELLSINVGDKRKSVVKYIVDSKIQGRHGFVPDWDHETFEQFGVRSVPQFFLISPKGEILMTHGDFRVAFGGGAKDLTEIVDNRLSGKALPTPAERPAEGKKVSAKSGNE